MMKRRFLISCALLALIGVAECPAVAEDPQVDAVRQQVTKKLGDKEDGTFILVFQNARAATIPANTKLPRGARRLPNNQWVEVLYQVEMVEGREAAVDLVMQFFTYTQQHAQGASFDWGIVARVEDATQAAQTLQAAQKKYALASVTYRPRTLDGLRFFNQPKARFFQEPFNNNQ